MVFLKAGRLLSSMSTVNSATLNKWVSDIQANPTLSLAATVAANASIQDVLLKRDHKTEFTNQVFNVTVQPEGLPRTNQQASGRCWLFAATNVLRIPLMKKLNMDKLQLSPSYLFFYDKLEKSNFFLNQIIDTANEDVDSRIVQHLLSDPISDGGQFSMFANIVSKYGLVPNNIYPDSFNSLASAKVNELAVTLLRQYAQELRELVAYGKSKDELTSAVQERLKTIHQLLVIHLGAPPAVDEEFTWSYQDKDKEVHTITTTPKKFVNEVMEFDSDNTLSLLNDPRNDYGKVIHVERLGNVQESKEVEYLNAEIDVLTEQAIKRLKDNKAVFFGTHTPIYHHNTTGIIDTGLWDYAKIGFNPSQSKADRLRYHQSLMTHAMAFVGVHLDNDGKPLRWKVENSWGKDKGDEGYYTMSHEFFKEYVYQVVIDKCDAPELAEQFNKKEDAVHLPAWDPCGSLAQ